MMMMLDYNVLSIVLSTIAVAGFIFLYRVTSKIPFLLAGAILYLKLLFCSFGLVSEFVFVVPELLVTIWISFILFGGCVRNVIVLNSVLFFVYMYWLLYMPHKLFGAPSVILMAIYLGLYYRTNETKGKKKGNIYKKLE